MNRFVIRSESFGQFALTLGADCPHSTRRHDDVIPHKNTVQWNGKEVRTPRRVFKSWISFDLTASKRCAQARDASKITSWIFTVQHSAGHKRILLNTCMRSLWTLYWRVKTIHLKHCYTKALQKLYNMYFGHVPCYCLAISYRWDFIAIICRNYLW